MEHPLDSFFYPGNDLGATYRKSHTLFKVWAPTQRNISLILYQEHDRERGTIYPMKRGEKGIWELKLKGEYKNKYYNYIIDSGDKSIEVTDPYAKGATINGEKGMIVDFKSLNPMDWKHHPRPQMASPTQAIIYEMHIRDFSMDKSSGMKNRGKFISFTETNTTNTKGDDTGVDYLKELGITHIHLLPIFDFGSVKEEKHHEYNWGYDPVLYNVPEGSYSTDPYHGEIRIRELKDTIYCLHQQDIGVIMDVVYNHTYIAENHPLELLVPGYYHRTDKKGNFTNGSGCGNELASERQMVRKYILDSLCFWAREYQIDGFRFDLMALHDQDTMNIIERELKKINPNIILYGEPWIGGPSSLPPPLQFTKGSQRGKNIALFNDEFREAIKGDNDGRGLGFVTGAKGLEEEIKRGIVGSIYYNEHIQGFAQEPIESVNYVSAHDNLTLYDKIEKSCPYATAEEKIKMNKLALSIILTSQGIAFIHGGAEILRSKKGYPNSYNMGDDINQVNWDDRYRYKDNVDYIKGLIALRKTQRVMTLSRAEEVKKHLKFIKSPPNVVAYRLTSPYQGDYAKILIIHNANREKVEIYLPDEEKWKVIANAQEVNIYGVTKEEKYFRGKIKLEPLSTHILVRD
ncbi:type I pullulanase [Irregularibacter muris]|uniref:Type I pullulanase n=1 Tax=Irregularibacter muris TaxID=1796619 RepID=A0AAE3HGG7_9FIRM|nr:type I pullulanase [Irregularibacter muris]MCR1898974.1 type I pullulanase [Irregularibacter muris]